jgi:hypothetical protein
MLSLSKRKRAHPLSNSDKLHYIDIDHMLLEGKLIRVSDRKNKKYMIKVGPMWVHFGDRRYQHYKDNTPLRAFSKLDHHDEKRRALYHKRHKPSTDIRRARYWANKYLW